ncbi:MAG: hypothetical protein U0R24_01885 [Solirubrobacterales bacterium]
MKRRVLIVLTTFFATIPIGFVAVNAIAGESTPAYDFAPNYNPEDPGVVGPYPDVLMGAGQKAICERVLADGLRDPGCETEVKNDYSDDVLDDLDQLPPMVLPTSPTEQYELRNGVVSGPVPRTDPDRPNPEAATPEDLARLHQQLKEGQ